MESIYVAMLGRFDIFVDGNSAMSNLSNSAKSILLLKYLLLNQGKPLPIANLIGLFWPEPDKSSNPESALKAMISRIRSRLSSENPALKDCILFENKSYMWNPNVRCTVDVSEFEELYHQLQSELPFDEETREKYIRILDLYGGDLIYSSSDEDWLVSRSMYLHHLYLTLVYKFIAHLKADKDYEMIIHVCRIALDIDAFDETLNLELMDALKKVGQSSEALMQYRHITSAYYKYLGIEPSDKILGFYRDLIKSDLATEADIEMIRQLLKESEDVKSGAFICDYSIFRDIYQLQLRNLERQEKKIFLSLVSVRNTLGEPMVPLVLDGIMRELLDILKGYLRKGDTIARYSTTQYAILLPMASYANSEVLVNRVRKIFYKRFSGCNIGISFQFYSME